jgi:hypothetical protein
MEEALGSPSESKLNNNARPPIQSAAVGKGSDGATAGLAVASHALRMVIVFAGPWLRVPPQLLPSGEGAVHHAATTVVVAFGLYYTHLL